MMNKYPVLNPSLTKHQSGVVLVISLIMLLALTLIGITSSSVTGLEEKMAANSKDVNLAFQAAESALRAAEATLKDKPLFGDRSSDTAQGTAGLYSILSECNGTNTTSATQRTATTLQPFYSNVNWNGTKVANYDSTKKLVGLANTPKYIIEEINCVTGGTSAGSGSLGGGSDWSSTTTKGETLTLRITAHGWGSNVNSVATVQSIVKVTYK